MKIFYRAQIEPADPLTRPKKLAFKYLSKEYYDA